MYAPRERWRERFDALNANGLETCRALVHEDLERGEKKSREKGTKFLDFQRETRNKEWGKVAPFERWEDTLLKYKHEITGILHVLACCLPQRV